MRKVLFTDVTLTTHAPGLGRLVVVFTHEFPVVHEIELVARVELSAAHDAGEALEVVDVILGASDDLGRRDSLVAPRALRTKTSVRRKSVQKLKINMKTRDGMVWPLEMRCVSATPESSTLWALGT